MPLPADAPSCPADRVRRSSSTPPQADALRVVGVVGSASGERRARRPSILMRCSAPSSRARLLLPRSSHPPRLAWRRRGGWRASGDMPSGDHEREIGPEDLLSSVSSVSGVSALGQEATLPINPPPPHPRDRIRAGWPAQGELVGERASNIALTAPYAPSTPPHPHPHDAVALDTIRILAAPLRSRR
ncbi:hypothetical protein T484DRAFT_1753016 [Baffinella frigidus]|nr:hypothetical protein T484DRAFT_1753016 [Cryptophyta sp. CCMP2293]